MLMRMNSLLCVLLAIAVGVVVPYTSVQSGLVLDSASGEPACAAQTAAVESTCDCGCGDSIAPQPCCCLSGPADPQPSEPPSLPARVGSNLENLPAPAPCLSSGDGSGAAYNASLKPTAQSSDGMPNPDERHHSTRINVTLPGKIFSVVVMRIKRKIKLFT